MLRYRINTSIHLLLALIFIICATALYQNIDIVDIFEYESDIFFEILEPEELRYTYRVRPATNFGSPMNDTVDPFKSKLIPTDPDHCCSVPLNADKIKGHIALVERGTCTFKKKALSAEEAGAIGVIISDFDDESDMYIDMLDDESVKDTSISAGFLLGKNGHTIKSTLKRLKRVHAEIHIPLNLTKTGVYEKKQPRWIVW